MQGPKLGLGLNIREQLIEKKMQHEIELEVIKQSLIGIIAKVAGFCINVCFLG